MGKFNTSQSIGEIVASLPKASEVFKQYHIDYCCGGNRPLSEAIKEQKLNEDEIMKKLNEADKEAAGYKNQTDFVKLSNSELIDYIVATHHAYLNVTLPQISELTTKILRVHGAYHEELFQVHKLFHNLKTEMDQHLIKEEALLFPLIKEYDQKPSTELMVKINNVMSETESEHDAAGDIIKELRKITKDFATPDDGCNTFYLTYDKLKELESDLFQHIHLENNILFKHFEILIN